MMKINILWSIVLLFCACSLDDQLAPSQELSITLLETVDTNYVRAGDTVHFKFIASTNVGTLETVKVVHKSIDFIELTDSIRFGMIDQEIPLTVDKSGKLSREVTTLLFIYPCIVPESSSINEMASLRFQVSASGDRARYVDLLCKVVNYYDHKKPLQLSTKSFMHYSAIKHKAYSMKGYVEHVEEVDLLFYVQDSSVIVSSPDETSLVDILDPEDKYQYDPAEMNRTMFLLLKNEFTFENIADEELMKLDFSTGDTQLPIVDDQLIGFCREDGQKGVLYIDEVKMATDQESATIKIKTKVQKKNL